ncbi:MAG TPA: cob(I)yrinic acid a,c-diamide adenosyltransferase [Solirubrobacteraceae bacterium]|nr:cob(I)yrinic acid a,c-diamide adenosyltransferase [Solirubrobacteraceae bacterium]
MVPTDTPERPPLTRQRSVVILNTGHGKGKSTAAFGVVMRGVARGWRVAVLQFVKSGRWKVGEEEIATRLGVDWAKTGDGFTWLTDDLERSRALAGAAWEQARSTIAAGQHRLVVLDELTYPVNWGWIDAGQVAEVLRCRPAEVNVVVTGRDAPEAIVEVADTVTEMRKVKHAYDRGVRAKRGLDF